MVLLEGTHEGLTAQERVAASPARPPYLQRGDGVEARNRSYLERLDRSFQDVAWGSAGSGRVGRHHFERLLRQQPGEVQ